jgi:hypothetical protein
MKRYILIMSFMLICTFSMAQSKDNGQELIDTFFDYYKTKGYAAALKYSLSTNKWIKSDGTEMDNIILALSKQVDVMGEYLGHEEIRSKTLGSRYRITSYLVYYVHDPVRFTFELYKTSTGWEISNFEFDTSFDEELEESMKLNSFNSGFR